MRFISTPVQLISIALMALFLSACSSGPPKPTVDYKKGYNFYNVNKFAFYKNSGQVSGDNPLQMSDMQRNRVDEALALAMASKGIVRVEDPSQAQLLLTWNLVTQNKTDVRTYQSASYGGGYGYGSHPYNRHSMYNCWNCRPTHTEVSVRDYTEGTFIVDLIDPKLKQSVWRGVTQSRLKGKGDQDQSEYNEAAAVIFASFPPPS